MFGRPQWFRATARRCGITPICWQGWMYLVVWTLVVIVPGCLLFATGRFYEVLIWLAATMTYLAWEAHQIRTLSHRVAAGGDDVLYIGDEPENEHVATQNFDLHLRR